jgi:hypothetical protein
VEPRVTNCFKSGTQKNHRFSEKKQRFIADAAISKTEVIFVWMTYSEGSVFEKYRSLIFREAITSAINTGTSARGPITAAKASPELIPNTAMANAFRPDLNHYHLLT